MNILLNDKKCSVNGHIDTIIHEMKQAMDHEKMSHNKQFIFLK